MSMTIPEQGCSIHKAEYSRNVSKCDLWCWALASFWMKCLSVWSRRFRPIPPGKVDGQQLNVGSTGRGRSAIWCTKISWWIPLTPCLGFVIKGRPSLLSQHETKEPADNQQLANGTCCICSKAVPEDTIFACANPVHSGIPRAAKSTSQFGGTVGAPNLWLIRLILKIQVDRT